MSSNIQYLEPSNKALSINIIDAAQKSIWLKIIINVTDSKQQNEYYTRPAFIINDSVAFQMSISRDREVMSDFNFYVKFTKVETKPILEQDYKIEYTHNFSNNLTIEKHFNADGKWRLIRTYDREVDNLFNKNFTISIKLCEKLPVTSTDSNSIIEKIKRLSPCAALHNDTVLTDVEMQARDGSIYMHKAIVAGVSPFLRAKFTSEWQATADGIVSIPETTITTLQHLKDYIYLDILPDNDLDELLLLASNFLITDLESRCVHKLMMDVTPDNVYHYMEFAFKYGIKRLLYGILRRVKNDLALENIPEFNSLDDN